ncbi:MAG TPA: Fic family protein, partial [Flavisolibacter sp.]|nr:Fic family protein [Flavisolibacter sp.]
MERQPVGSQWLKEKFRLHDHTLTHASFIGSSHRIELSSRGNVEEIYRSHYNVVRDEPIYHIEFSLKYDDVNLDFLKAVFERIAQQDVEVFVNSSPGSKYARKIGFLYEFLTGKKLSLERPVSGNYTDLLNNENYITGTIIKNSRWRINDNLPGTPEFCPVIRRTGELQQLLREDIGSRIETLKRGFTQDVFNRAILYLFKKETRSSYQIEREEPSSDRMEKFITLLTKAGLEPNDEIISKPRLVQLQNAIVDPRYAAQDYRDHTIYIGESLPNSDELIYYIGPPASMVNSLMNGLKDTTIKSTGVHAAVRAALIAFGFVFIHPFEDGNGRIHRFLIHDILVHDKMVPYGIIVPVSAHMLNHIRAYDAVLEKYSKPLMQRIRYDKKLTEEIVITNSTEVEGYFRYPDLTDQCVYLLKTILATIEQDMPGELLFIHRYDEAKK